jgi:hypothetical protein
LVELGTLNVTGFPEQPVMVIAPLLVVNANWACTTADNANINNPTRMLALIGAHWSFIIWICWIALLRFVFTEFQFTNASGHAVN